MKLLSQKLLLLFFLSVLSFLMSGCFTTLQTAKIKKGFQLSASAGILSDQTRNDKSQGDDLVCLISPSYGFGNTVGLEIGLPIGWYLEEGLNSLNTNAGEKYGYDVSAFLILPYLKLGLNQQKKDKLAIICQSFLIEPVSLSLLYSHDLQCFTPYVSLKTIFGGGQPLDKAFLARYQQDNQTIFILSIGAQLNIKLSPVVEAGIMRNSYEEDDNCRIVLYDFFIGTNITL